MELMDIIGIVILVGLGILFLVGLVYYGMRDDEDNDPLQERLADYGDRELPSSLEELEMQLPFTERVVKPMFQTLARMVIRITPEQQIEESRRLLQLAGNPGNMDASTFLGMRVGATIGFALLAFMLFFVVNEEPNALLYTGGAAGLGYFMPQMWVKSKITRRQEGVVKSLPDALDLLTICVEAGLGFDSAMGKIYEKWDDDLSLEFGRALKEIQLGKMRREALRDMSERLDVPDVTSFVAAIVQATDLGVSMARILRVQSDQMRVKRRQRAQEKAQKAPVKMMIPMVLLIFPSIWIVLLGPSLIVIKDMPSGIF